MILYLVLDHEGKPSAAYPRELQAKVYASGHSKACTIVAGEFTAFQQSFAPDAPPESCEHGNLRGKCPVEICSYSKHGGRR